MANPKQDKVAARLRLRITAAAESILRAGHPWLFANSIREQNRQGESGELAVIYDRNNRFLAIGLYDPDSPIRVRVLHTGKSQTINPQWWSTRLERSLARREGLFDANTTGFRWINGESDGWPGLVLDRYSDTLVLKLYVLGWLPRLNEILTLIRNRMQPERLVLRLSRNIQATAAQHHHKDGEILYTRSRSNVQTPVAVAFLETGLRFEADICRGQKTGFFLDQRENRRRVEALARGRTVLNAFSFSGGFSLYAARGGATAVTDLDLSRHALDSARRNFALNESNNQVASCSHELIHADAFDWLNQDAKRKFDLIILDPPSLAKREAERPGAIRAYNRLAQLGLKHLAPNGILVACSCSAHVTADEFFATVRNAAATSKRPFTEQETTNHPPDHPATFTQAEYLKAIYLRFSKVASK